MQRSGNCARGRFSVHRSFIYGLMHWVAFIPKMRRSRVRSSDMGFVHVLNVRVACIPILAIEILLGRQRETLFDQLCNNVEILPTVNPECLFCLRTLLSITMFLVFKQ
jgi:hypothetical protein